MKTCRDCNGDGVVEKGTDDEQQCPTCGGSGFAPDDNDGQEEVIHTKAAELSTAAYFIMNWLANFSAIPGLAKHHLM